MARVPEQKTVLRNLSISVTNEKQKESVNKIIKNIWNRKIFRPKGHYFTNIEYHRGKFRPSSVVVVSLTEIRDPQLNTREQRFQRNVTYKDRIPYWLKVLKCMYYWCSLIYHDETFPYLARTVAHGLIWWVNSTQFNSVLSNFFMCLVIIMNSLNCEDRFR